MWQTVYGRIIQHLQTYILALSWNNEVEIFLTHCQMSCRDTCMFKIVSRLGYSHYNHDMVGVVVVMVILAMHEQIMHWSVQCTEIWWMFQKSVIHIFHNNDEEITKLSSISISLITHDAIIHHVLCRFSDTVIIMTFHKRWHTLES